MAVKKANHIPYVEMESATPLQRLRWNMHRRQGISHEEIAKEHGCDAKLVRQSIARVDALLDSFTLEEAARLQVDKVRRLHGVETRMLQDAMRAEIVISFEGRKVTKGPDWETRMRAFEAMTARLSAIQPKGGGINIDASKKENHLHTGGEIGQHAPGKSFEDILRKVRGGQQAALEAGPDVVADLEIPMMSEEDMAEDAAAEAEILEGDEGE